jgi:hypothetical protein
MPKPKVHERLATTEAAEAAEAAKIHDFFVELFRDELLAICTEITALKELICSRVELCSLSVHE